MIFVLCMVVSHRKFGNCWVGYMNLIDLMDHPSNMEIGLYWYQGSNNEWTYDLPYHLIVDLETIIASASTIYTLISKMLMSYIQEMKKSSLTWMINARVFNYIYDGSWLLFKSIFVNLCWLFMNVYFYNTYYHLYFNHWKCMCIAWIYQKETCTY